MDAPVISLCALPATACARRRSDLAILSAILRRAARPRLAGVGPEVIRLRPMLRKTRVIGHGLVVLRAGGIVLGLPRPG